MAPRRVPSNNTLSPLDPSAPSPPFPRSTSPSSGFAQFLSKPSKWFTRSSSTGKLPSGTNEPRSSNASSTTRKPKISRPTDPRPILNSYPSDPHLNSSASRSLLDLSRTPTSLEIGSRPHPSSPSAPSSPNAGLGDLRGMSRKPWSRSADDLGKLTSSPLSPIKTSFQDKVAEYRNRSNSNASGMSPSTPSSSPITMTSRHPFPSATLSPSPPNLPTLSISGPDVENGTHSQNSQTHAHTRSHSFTPRQPSKLITSKIGSSSPTRSGSGSSEQELDREFRGKSRSAGTSTLVPPVRGTFPFSFVKPLPPDPSGAEAPAPMRSTVLLSPPEIIEPYRAADDVNPKRSSQIVYHSGFINRLSDNSPALLHPGGHFTHATLPLLKGWKPFKMEMKGSKLYFFKPPSDRSAAIKELFPSDFVPLVDEEPEETDIGHDDGENGANGKMPKGQDRDETVGRKKRAFWGRGMHPELSCKDGQVDSGTFEAFVHETVFGASFWASPTAPQTSAPNGAQITTEQRENWKSFASAILLCLPSLVGRAKFETEFTRVAAHLVNGSDDSSREDDRARVEWLAGEYLRYHAAPLDAASWKEWAAETIPSASFVQQGGFAGMPVSASTQGLYAPTPLLGSESPNFDTFSPRPGESGNQVSLMNTLNEGLISKSRAEAGTGEQNAQSQSRMPWGALAREGLSRDVLFSFDPRVIAKSLGSFHRSIVEQTPEDLTAEFIFDSETPNTPQDPETLSRASSLYKPLFGSDDHPHWLTKLLLMQILGPETSNMNSSMTGRMSENPSRTHARSELISIWVRVAELCRNNGDECSWRAICAAVCSRPIARLDKVWKRVDPQAVSAVESWVYPGSNGEWLSVKEPKLVPWGGDVKCRIGQELEKAPVDDTKGAWRVAPLQAAKALYEGLRTSFSLCPRRTNSEVKDVDDVRRMAEFWREMSLKGDIKSGMAAKFVRIDQFTTLSFSAEPRRKGLFEPYHFSRSSPPTNPRNALVPLLFPEPLPYVSLIDRAQLLRGRIDSNAADLEFLRTVDTNLRQGRRRSLGNASALSGMQIVLGGENGGTTIPLYDGDLLLVVTSAIAESSPGSQPSSRGPSRPPSTIVDPTSPDKGMSRNPSIRVKPGSSLGLDRKPSTARRNSLPSISQRQSFVAMEPSSERPLRVLVQAGTINCLVDILVHGIQGVSVSVADDNGEMSLGGGKTRDLMVDHDEFGKVWWNVFRSFVTPLVFFELLRKDYLGSQPRGTSPPVEEYLTCARIRSEVLGTIKEWFSLGGGARDALDDCQLYGAMKSFFESGTDHHVAESAAYHDSRVKQAWASLRQTETALATSFTFTTMRPPRIVNQTKPSVDISRVRQVAAEEPDFNSAKPEDLVNYLDGMAFAAFSNVTEEDLLVAADLLEVQSADRTGWFLSREPNATEETIEIQTIYSQMQEVEPSSMIPDLGQDVFYRLLPASIRNCIRAYTTMRKWLISKIIATKLGLRNRQARIELLLRAIELARQRSLGPAASSAQLTERPCIRSFVEVVVTSAVVSSESRIYSRAWQNIAFSRGASGDSLSSLLCRPSIEPSKSQSALTVDIGWIMERTLELITTPDVVESPTQEGHGLVNYEKRRCICNFIRTFWNRGGHKRDELDRRYQERMNIIEKEIAFLYFDPRILKEEAQREGAQIGITSTPSAKKIHRPFNRLVTLQIEKNRRDKNTRERLSKEKKNEEQRNKTREDILNKAMRPRKPGMEKQHRPKKSMSSVFSNFMRPISSAFSSEAIYPIGVKRTAAELDFAPSGKPSLVVNLVDARVNQFINSERSFTFQLDTEDGGHYILQAATRRDMLKWMDTISHIAKLAAKRRLTYLGNSPKPQLSDHLHNQPRRISRDPFAVFGVELEYLLRREAGNGEIQPGIVPLVIERCLSEVESRGLTEVGIYRIPGASSEINALKDAFNRGESPITRSTDIHAVCDLIKTWFRLLPEPVFPSSAYFEIIEAMKLDNLDMRISRIQNVVRHLPQANFDLLKRVSEHLDRVTDFEEQNQMTAEALAIVFSPNLMRAPHNDFVMILANMGQTHKLVKALITHFHVIFDDVDQDADPEEEEEDDDEYTPPILEEDEDEDPDASIPISMTPEPQDEHLSVPGSYS